VASLIAGVGNVVGNMAGVSVFVGCIYDGSITFVAAAGAGSVFFTGAGVHIVIGKE